MRGFRPYVERLESLVARATRRTSGADPDILAALDGEPAEQLRRLVPLEDARSAGAFFTGSCLAKRLVGLVAHTITPRSILVDPACGAGDLLLACSNYLPTRRSFQETLSSWGRRLAGRDLYPEFIRASKLRLAIAAIHRGTGPARNGRRGRRRAFPGIHTGSGLSGQTMLRAATHIVANPPFTRLLAPPDCEWGQGKVNAAALFIEACLLNARVGTKVAAILPDVLRSGSRYVKWRSLVESLARIQKVEVVGQFDSKADVDVFMLYAVVTDGQGRRGGGGWDAPKSADRGTIGDLFSISIGTVVPHRHPEKGPWRAYITPHDLPPWGVVANVPERRRYSGATHRPPFVAIRRTSRPGDKHRAIGTLVRGARKVAVENHLVVARPKDGSIKRCEELLRFLQTDHATVWLNRRIRCRHLTVSSLSQLPCPEDDHA